MTAIGQKKSPLTHWFSLEIHVKETESRTQVKPTCAILETIGSMNRTSGQPQVKLSLLHRRRNDAKEVKRNYSEICLKGTGIRNTEWNREIKMEKKIT